MELTRILQKYSEASNNIERPDIMWEVMNCVRQDEFLQQIFKNYLDPVPQNNQPAD